MKRESFDVSSIPNEKEYTSNLDRRGGLKEVCCCKALLNVNCYDIIWK